MTLPQSLAENQSAPDARSGFFAALLDTGPSFKGLRLIVHADALTPAIPEEVLHRSSGDSASGDVPKHSLDFLNFSPWSS